MPKESLTNLLYRGSVKDVYGLPGIDPYVFKFSDRYSIFDWGEMPDALPGKGEALSTMGDLFFRYLGRSETWAGWKVPLNYPSEWRDSLSKSSALAGLRVAGLRHHSMGLVDEEGDSLPEGAHSRCLAVRALSRPEAKSSVQNGKVVWDYSAYQERPTQCLVPLEVVFRFGAPEGSSFLSRAEKIPGYAESFGFESVPKAGEVFPFPVVEFFTKLEPSDRFLTRKEALLVGGLNEAELARLEALSLLLALRLRDVFAPLGLELWDGKFEFAFTAEVEGERGFMLVDSIGPDELRLIGPGGVHFSKEFLRRVYRGTPWYEAMELAKKTASERGEKDWKKICREEFRAFPEKLPRDTFENARLMYPALANELGLNFLGRAIYEDVPRVFELCERIRRSL